MKNTPKPSLVAVLLLLTTVSQVSVYAKGGPSTDKAKGKAPAIVQTMHGYVSANAQMDPVAQTIDDVMSKAVERSAEAQKAQQRAKKYGSKAQRAFKATKDAVNYMVCDRGFLPSMEGMSLMMDENDPNKVNSKNSADYSKQHWLDATHDRVVSDVLELATALGTEDEQRRTEMVNTSMKSIAEVAGEDGAKSAYDHLNSWYQTIKDQPLDVATTSQWSPKQRQDKIKVVVDNCLKQDPIAEEIKKRAHKYKHGKAARFSSQVVETTLNTVSLTPTIVGPAAQAALLGFFMLTGGCEEDKLISEMYLGKRLQSRKQSFTQQASWAIEGYQIGVLTKNKALAACSESLIRRLGGPDVWAQVFQATNAANAAAAADQSATGPKPNTDAQVAASDKKVAE